HVTIAEPGAAPGIGAIDVGHLAWQEQSCALATAGDLAELINEVAIRPASERRLLRLRLSGTLDAETMLRLRQLHEVLDRYLFAELDDSELRIHPTEDEIGAAAGEGVLRRVLARLREDADHGEPALRRVAERAMVLLYQIAEDIRA